MRKLRENRKLKESEMPRKDRESLVERRRKAKRENVNKYRKRKKLNKNCQNESRNSQSYKTRQTLGKAVNKATRALPNSPRKKKLVLAKMIANLEENDKKDVIASITGTTEEAPRELSELEVEIREFFSRDDVSCVSPKEKHVKSYICPMSGKAVQLPLRLMLLSLREAHALFTEERTRDKKGKFP